MKILFKNKDFLNLYLEKLNILSNKNKIDSLFSFLNPYEDSAVAIMSTFEPYYYPEVKSIMENNAEHIRNVLKKENPSIILYEIDSNNIILKIKNFNYVPFKILGIYHNNNLISKFDKNYLIKGKNYGEPIKNEKIKILISEKISFSDSLQLKFQYLGEKTNNIISFKF